MKEMNEKMPLPTVEQVPAKHTAIGGAGMWLSFIMGTLFWAAMLHIDADSIWSIKCTRVRIKALLTGSHSEGLTVLAGQ